MGNCVDRQRAVSWVDDEDDGDDERDWASSEESVSSQDDDNKNEMDKNEREPLSRGRGTTTTEVKIKITKKQLEKLLKQVDEDGKDLTIQQVLADLMLSSDDPGRHWKPALHSIPEASE